MRWVLLTLFLLMAAAVGMTIGGVHYLKTPLSSGVQTKIWVEKGARLRPLLKKLQHEDVLALADALYLYARLSGQTKIKTGYYTFSSQQTPLEILDSLLEGRVELISLTLPEGWNRWQIRNHLAQQGLVSPATFDALCDDSHFLSTYKIPGPTCEGYMFPETYRFSHGMSAAEIFAALFDAYKRAYHHVIQEGLGPLELSEREFVTLASIVEKETAAPEERSHIACVFYNRLKDKTPWKLQTDPTVIYAALSQDPNFDGNIKRSHLRELDSPYNTYRLYGLPKGPIANAGFAALQAVAKPAVCKDFYFVSSNNGHHIFCPTLKCHNQAVQTYQVDYFKKKAPAAKSQAEVAPPPKALKRKKSWR